VQAHNEAENNRSQRQEYQAYKPWGNTQVTFKRLPPQKLRTPHLRQLISPSFLQTLTYSLPFPFPLPIKRRLYLTVHTYHTLNPRLFFDQLSPRARPQKNISKNIA
jgi:hypothetical protein